MDGVVNFSDAVDQYMVIIGTNIIKRKTHYCLSLLLFVFTTIQSMDVPPTTVTNKQYTISDQESGYQVKVDETIINLVPVVKRLAEAFLHSLPKAEADKITSFTVNLRDDYASGTVESLFEILRLPMQSWESKIKELSFSDLFPTAFYAYSLNIDKRVGDFFNRAMKSQLELAYIGRINLEKDDYEVLKNFSDYFRKTIISDAEWLSLVDKFNVTIMKKNYKKENIRFKALGNKGDINKITFSPKGERIACMVQDDTNKSFLIPCILDWQTTNEYYCQRKTRDLCVAFSADGLKMIYESEGDLIGIDIGVEKIEPSRMEIFASSNIKNPFVSKQGEVFTDRLAISSDSKCAFATEHFAEKSSVILVIDLSRVDDLMSQPGILFSSQLEKPFKISSSSFIHWLRFNQKDGSILYLKDIYSPYRYSGADMRLCSIAQANNYSGSHRDVLDSSSRVKDGRSVALSRNAETIAFITTFGSVEVRWLNEPHNMQIMSYNNMPIESIGFSHDGRLLIGVIESGEIVVWSTKAGNVLGTFKGLSKNKSISMSDDGKKLIVGGRGDLFMWDFMFDDDLSALDTMKSNQITKGFDQMVLLHQIYSSNKKRLTEAEMSVFEQMPPEICSMLKNRGFVADPNQITEEPPKVERPQSQTTIEHSEQHLQPVQYLKELIKKNWNKLQQFLNVMKAYHSHASS